MPPLELFLPADRAFHVAEHLEVYEAVDFVLAGESGQQALAVLDEPLEKVRRHTDVEGAVVPAGEDVDARGALAGHRSARASEWTLKQVQGDEDGEA